MCKWPLNGLIVCVSLLEHRMTCCMLYVDVYICVHDILT